MRICDIGGWTDTWFAVTGAVFSVAVEPRVRVDIDVTARGREPQVSLSVDGKRAYGFEVGSHPGRRRLLEAAFARAGVPEDVHLEVRVRPGVPPGCGTGTSAAVVVALLGALDRLTPGIASPHELAAAAHRVETDGLGLQSGVQDQLASAFGGINLFEVRYPDAKVHPVTVSSTTRSSLARRLVLVSLGRPHRSSAIHEQVIAGLTATGGDAPGLEVLRLAARSAADATEAGDLEALGEAMRASTEAQRSLHPTLVSDHAQEIIDAAAHAGASGWKVNGAGGDGGSVTLLAGGGAADTTRLLEAINALAGPHQVLPIRLADRGVVVADTR